MNVLPKKFKKQIIEFCKEYESLACPHKIRITIPKKELIVEVVWESDNSCGIDENSINRALNSEDVYKCNAIVNYNKKIKKFIEKTMKFGKINFNNKDWLWHRILWNYRPECGEKYNFKNVKWR